MKSFASSRIYRKAL